MIKRLALLVVVILGLVHSSHALELHPLFSDGAVLQQGRVVPVWGTARPGAKVSVSFHHQSVKTEADGTGKWRVDLDPLQASFEPLNLVVTDGSATLTIKNVLVGEVWLASGQSNMASPLSSGSAAEALPSATDSAIRFFTVEKNVAAAPLASPSGKWQISDPTVARNFSAVAYFFARSIRQAQNVPIGVLHASWGGTPIRAWMSAGSIEGPPPAEKIYQEWRDALAKHEAAAGNVELLQAYYQDRKDWEENVDKPFRAARTEWQAAADAARISGQPPPPQPKHERPRPESPDPLAMPAPGTSDRPSAPTGCFNAMIAPLAPFALRGVLWYQGEADASRGLEYRDLLLRLITGWRAYWQQGDFPFLIVQLPGHGKNDELVASKGIAWLREAQDMAQSLPEVFIAVTSDLGDAVDVHPDNKLPTGERLALVAREAIYEEKVAGLSPRYRAMRVDGSRAIIEFDHASGGLKIGRAPWVAKSGVELPQDRVVGFFIAGDDRRWVEAEAVIEGDTIVLSAPSVAAPVAVRYAWANTPQANLANQAGLPVAPFRTDDWPQ